MEEVSKSHLLEVTQHFQKCHAQANNMLGPLKNLLCTFEIKNRTVLHEHFR